MTRFLKLNGSDKLDRNRDWNRTVSLNNNNDLWLGGKLTQQGMIISSTINTRFMDIFTGIVDLVAANSGEYKKNTIILYINSTASSFLKIDSIADNDCNLSHFPNKSYLHSNKTLRFSLPALPRGLHVLSFISPYPSDIYLKSLEIYFSMCHPNVSVISSNKYECNCREGYYRIDKSKGLQEMNCAKCPFYCQVCSGPNRNQCSKPINSYILKNITLNSTLNSTFDKESIILFFLNTLNVILII